jgi:hypothetical protein
LFNGYDFDVEQLRHQVLQDKRKQELRELEDIKKTKSL